MYVCMHTHPHVCMHIYCHVWSQFTYLEKFRSNFIIILLLKTLIAVLIKFI